MAKTNSRKKEPSRSKDAQGDSERSGGKTTTRGSRNEQTSRSPAGTRRTGRSTKSAARQATSRGESTSKPRWARSLATRQEILDATIDCFIDIGYVRTTTTEIAKKAGFTRGAVQYYFPTTQHVLEASINYLTEQWLEEYAAAARNAPPGADYIDYAVDVLWRFVNDRLFVAWQELVAASRTDAELRQIILPAAARFEKMRRESARANFPDFHDAGVVKFERNRDTLRFVLEGMTSTILTYQKKERIEAQLDWLKEWFHSDWREELEENRIQNR